MKKIAEYGTWKSPITGNLVAGKSVGLGGIQLAGESVYWVESRPHERGRTVVHRLSPDDLKNEMIPKPFNARTKVHEYGGGSYFVHGEALYFSNFSDQQIYRADPTGNPVLVTTDAQKRYAGGVITPDGASLICVMEDHAEPSTEPQNSIALVDLENGQSVILAGGNDFYGYPVLNPDGDKLAWLTWNHPQMPWDGTELWVATFTGERLEDARKVAGSKTESIFQPQWSPGGELFFVSDRNGWWNLYRAIDEKVAPVIEMEAEFGFPQWVFDMSTYGFQSADTIVAAALRDGRWQLLRIHLAGGDWEPLETPYHSISEVRVSETHVTFLGGSPNRPTEITQMDLETQSLRVLAKSGENDIEPGYLSLPESITFQTEGGLDAYGYFYSPQNKDYTGPKGQRPPLIVISHGGPTSSARLTLNLAIQFWTSRGFGVVDVNYGGSTGYGRAYRERLLGQWGVVDLDDCVNAARALVQRGEADPERLIIRGGSAGGYTTLCALTFRDVFKAGASYYGVSDLESLASDDHKFESRYLDSMVGPYPEMLDLYRARSPIRHTDRLKTPVIFFQGLEDRVVPPDQAERMVAVLSEKGVPVAYVPFEGEQHGFRIAANIQRSLEAELFFYGKVFGFEPADEIEPVEIKNL